MKKNKKKQFDLLIIGGGAAGMMAAITAAREHKKIAILEKEEKLGKKIFASGNGKCNFTNAHMQTDCFHADETFISYVLEQFSLENCLDFFRSIGISPKNKNGYYYPNSEQASSIVTALTLELERLGVSIFCNTFVKGIEKQAEQILIQTSERMFACSEVLIATGLLAAPKLGSDGSLFDIVKSLGHRFAPILPALCGFYGKGIPFKKVSGVRAYGTVQAIVDGVVLATDTGEMQFTEYGLSGIPVFQISHFLSKALYQKQNVQIGINLLPDFSHELLLEELERRKIMLGEHQAEYFLNGLLHQKLANMILEKTHIEKDTMIVSLTKENLENIAHQIQHGIVNVTKYRDYEFAQVCIGGIPISDICPKTLESKFTPHIYFAGEILDVDGICGGYNLHFAWASGYIAGKHAVERSL